MTDAHRGRTAATPAGSKSRRRTCSSSARRRTGSSTSAPPGRSPRVASGRRRSARVGAGLEETGRGRLTQAASRVPSLGRLCGLTTQLMVWWWHTVEHTASTKRASSRLQPGALIEFHPKPKCRAENAVWCFPMESCHCHIPNSFPPSYHPFVRKLSKRWQATLIAEQGSDSCAY